MTTSTGIELVWIPPGEFMLGSTQQEQDWAVANKTVRRFVTAEGSQPRKAIIHRGFWMGRTEVTVGQWKKFVAATHYLTDGEKLGEAYVPAGPGSIEWVTKKGASWQNPSFGTRLKDNHPVCCISWPDAVAFCEWLNETEQKANKLPQGCKYRLPAEVEWEYACRAGKQTKFWWGDKSEGAELRMNWAGTQDGCEFAAPVDHYGSRGRNKFGLADMLGNVSEWCLDGVDPTQAHGEFPTDDRPAPSHVIRGGSFRDFIGSVRCAARTGGKTDIKEQYAYAGVGFRVCCGPGR